jgi:hypothetical protein
VSLFVWLLLFDLSSLGDPTSSYATAGIALRVAEARKLPHHDKVQTPSGEPSWELPHELLVELGHPIVFSNTIMIKSIMYIHSQTKQCTFLPYWLLVLAITAIIRPILHQKF